jgi:hypothetical protein
LFTKNLPVAIPAGFEPATHGVEIRYLTERGVGEIASWMFHNLRYPKISCSSKAKMSALSKVEMSVSAPFGSSEAVISMGMVVMSKRELNRLDVLARLRQRQINGSSSS